VNKQDITFINKIRKKVSKTMLNYSMLQENDRVLIAFSGGKDSIVVSDILNHIKKKVNFKFDLSAIMIGNEHAKNIKSIKQQMENINIEVIPFSTQTIDKTKNKPFCQICSRIRRGTIYDYAIKNNFNKIVLGHHLDDVVETFFMNQFYQAKLETMKPIFTSDDGNNIIIRPLHPILEEDILKYFNLMEFNLLQAYCPFGVTRSKRSEIKNLLNSISDIEKYNIYHSIEELF
jgi:tRNA 2-thiocytidine biosynthesis protein TtcA